MSSSLFLHALARFRSSLPLSQAELLGSRHGYDLSVALRKAFWLLEGSLPDFAICWREAEGASKLHHLCLSHQGVAFDLFGTNVMERLREADFEDGFTLRLSLFDSHVEFQRSLVESDYFSSWWPASRDELAQLESGILIAAEELAPPV